MEVTLSGMRMLLKFVDLNNLSSMDVSPFGSLTFCNFLQPENTLDDKLLLSVVTLSGMEMDFNRLQFPNAS